MTLLRPHAVLVLLIWLFWTSVSDAAAMEDPVHVSFLPQWTPQAQFAGYYVAYEKGFYQHRGLQVSILRGGPERPPATSLQQGKTDFATMFLSTGIAKRAQGLKLINICQVVQRSALMLVAKKSSGIHSPEDLQGRKVGLWPGEYRIQPEAFFRKYNLTVTVVPQTTTMNLFLRDGVDGASAMWYNEYHTLLNAGLDPEDLTTFFYSDHGMNFPEDGIYCMEETLRRNPEVCRAFVEASLEGWRYAFAHPGLALAIVMKHIGAANTAANQVHQQWMLARMRDIIISPGSDGATGILDEQAYSRVCRELSQRGMFLRSPPFPNFYVSLLPHAEK